ncbi:DUF3422 family protein [Aliikangiella coralliicola]|uniref:DUF3422 domain-containing protein n=1 Tax=Aliikangiella coralliicola TaxID=2592383 RepID=A0A545UDA1_9GAMM|nr:DUF3422 domain-containing protein [Aliikangiella coralliicola]TQV87413.1 DUF3422 domain-containing protein [Aliikangiella coralliicola]
MIQAKSNKKLPQLHPLMSHLANEIHSRSFPRIQGAVIVSQATMLHYNSDKQAQINHLKLLAEKYDANLPNQETSCYYADLGELDIRWEHHSEFSTYTVIRLNNNEQAFECPPWHLLPLNWRQSLPGQLIAAIHLDVRENLPEASGLQKIFLGHSLLASVVAENNAQVWTSFKTSDDGFERLLIIDQGLTQSQTGRLLRCLLELSSYRMVALLSLPVSRELMPQVAEMESELARITLLLSRLDEEECGEKNLLSQLSALSARLESIIADNQFRFDASNAYFELVTNRIAELNETEIPGKEMLSDFLNRRMIPAFRTGKSVTQRTLNISNRIDKASDLLQTRINLDLEEQNQDLLKAINRRSHIQLKLHQLVESVSMFAISYYIIQLISYTLVLPQHWQEKVSKELVVAASVPLVIFGVWFLLHKLKRRWWGLRDQNEIL